MGLTITTTDKLGQYFRIVDSYSEKTSNHYSSEGSGFGYFTFNVFRKYGVNYADLGYGYTVLVTKGLKKVLFHGFITKIEENSDGVLGINCVGFNTLTSFDIVNWVFADNRTNRWVTACNPRGSYRPDKFDHSLQWTVEVGEDEIAYDGIEIVPRNSVDFTLEDYYYIRYRFEFGEIAKRLTATWELRLPSGWPGKVEIRDGAGNVLWDDTNSGNGSLDLDLYSIANTNYVEVVFTVTTSGLNTSDAVYFRMWDINVSSVARDVIAWDVLSLVLGHMRDNYGFSDDNGTDLQFVSVPLTQVAFDNDETLDKIATYACSFGDTNSRPLAWGVKLDDTKQIFLEEQDFSTIRYILYDTDPFTVQGDIVESYQKVYGKYPDVYGQTQRTATLSADEEIESLGLYRRTVIDFDSSLTTDLVNLGLAVALNENKQPTISTDFSLEGWVRNSIGGIIPVDEIQSGGMVQVPILSARETSVVDDKRSGFHTFMLTQVEIDLENQTATLSPAQAKSNFEKYMERVSKI